MIDSAGYHRTKMKRENVLRSLKERGFRITKQRRMLLDIILEDECSCCKEIFYQASKRNQNIGAATVYRMINILEEIGAISRRNMYRIACGEVQNPDTACRIELDDKTVIELSQKKWNEVIKSGLRACGYIENQEIIDKFYQ
ncbi:MAG: transcriptional repressor [Lachnospiraceae bacterium]